VSTKTPFFSIRIPPEIGEQLRKVADDNTRTLAAQILHYVKQGLAAEGKK
jgi:hypothetical protein